MRWAVRVLLAGLLSLATTTLAVPPKAPVAPLYSKEDVCIAWVLHSESRGEPLKGQRAVYDVVKRRMVKRNLTACEVVKEPSQFSGYKHGMVLAADEEMLQRLRDVRRIPPVAPYASYFHSKQVKPSWRTKMKRVLSIGGHVFYMKPKQPKEKQK